MNQRHLLIFIFLFAWVYGYAQNDSILNRIVVSAREYTNRNPNEKVYLQTDRSLYASGDDIWFKAYVTTGRHQLSGISGVLNVELVDDKNRVEKYIKLPLISGLTWGDFKLPDTLSAGNYRICAYTNWMRNAGSDFFFQKHIIIVNPSQSEISGAKNTQHTTGKKEKANKGRISFDVQFFPESGNLVYGIKSKVAFKAVGKDGLGKDIKGVIVDDEGRELANFATAHLGMGSFDLLPEPGKKYSAHVTYPDGSNGIVSLPLPVTTGYVMHALVDSLNIRLQIEACRDSIAGGNSGLYLVAQSGGEVYFAAGTKTANSVFTAVVPKSKFPSGVVQFTLFSGTGEPLSERLVFIQNSDQLAIGVTSPGASSAIKGKSAIRFIATKPGGKPALGNFSAAVINESLAPVDENEQPTILSYLLLTSDLKGYIEQPGYYFTNVNGQKRADLDLLMLTQGYRRFEWKKALAGNVPPAMYQPERSLQITGQITRPGGKPYQDVNVSIMNNAGGFFLCDTVSGKDGSFVFTNLQYKDSTRFIVRSKGAKDSRVTVDTTVSSPIVPLNHTSIADTTGKDSLAVFIASSKKIYDQKVVLGLTNKNAHVLHEVKIVAKKPVLENSSNLNGPGRADQVVMAKDFPKGCPLISNCLGVGLKGVHFEYDDYGVGHPITFIGSKPAEMKIKLDGFDVNAETLNILPPEMIESVEVLRSDTYISAYGNDGYHGLLLVNTKKGGYQFDKPQNIQTYIARSYYKAREFYSPRYDVSAETGKQLPDLRTTIYWNPNIPTDKNGKASIEYFNSVSKGTYRVIIEGIDADGNLGYEVYRYKVE